MIAESAKPRAIAVWFKDLRVWSPRSVFSLGWHWPDDVVRPLSSAIQRKMLPIDKEGVPMPPMVTLHFDGTVEPRASGSADKLKGRLFLANAGDVIYSKIDVRNGAIGVVPDQMPLIAATSEYPVYTVDHSVALPKYIQLLFRTAQFRNAINALVSGASGRKRVDPSDLEDLAVPLPSLHMQRRIVEVWQAAQKEASETAERIAKLEKESEARFLTDLGLTKPQPALLPKVFAVWWKNLQSRWGVDINQQAIGLLDPASGMYPVSQVSDVIADLENGWSPKCHEHPAKDDEWGVLKLGSVSFGFFDETENKALLSKMKPRPELEVKPGDWLISRANVTRLVGACALVRETRPHLMLCDKIFRAVWRDPSPVLPEYLNEIVKVPHLRQQIENNVTGTSATMKNITKPSLLGLRIPLPPLAIQRQLVAKVMVQHQKITAMRTEARKKTEQAKAEVEAMILGSVPVRIDGGK